MKHQAHIGAVVVVALFASPALPCSIAGPAGQAATAFPADGAAGVPTNSDVFLDEQGAGSLTTIVEATFEIEGAGQAAEAVPVALDGSGNVYRLDLPELLESTTYLVAVRNTADFGGVEEPAPRVIRLTTGDAADVDAPALAVPTVSTRAGEEDDVLVLCGDFDANTTIVDVDAAIEGAVAARLFEVNGDERTLMRRELFVAEQSTLSTSFSDKRAGRQVFELVAVDAAGNETAQRFTVDLGRPGEADEVEEQHGGCEQTSSSTAASLAALVAAVGFAKRRRRT